MPKFIVAADLHLKNRTWSRLPLSGDAYAGLEEVCTLATGCAGLILAGDLFVSAHQPDMPENLRRLIKATQRVRDVVYAVGNHDKTGNPGGFVNPEWVESVLEGTAAHWHYAEDEVHNVAGVRFVTLHHTSSREELVNRLMRLAGTQFDVLVMHQGFKETISIEGQYETNSDEVSTWLQQTGCQCVITGHIHKPMSWTTNGMLFVSPGSTYKCTLDKNEPDCCCGVLTAENGTIGYEFVPLKDQRKMLFLDALPADPSKLAERAEIVAGLAKQAASSTLPKAVKKPLVTFDYVVMPGVVSAMAAAAGDAVCVEALPIHTAVYRHRERKADDNPAAEYIDFATTAAKHAGGAALEVIMAVYRGEDPEIALNRELEKITGRAV